MKAKAFFKTWKAFVNEKTKDKDIWEGNKGAKRTIELFGKKGSSKTDSPFGNYFQEHNKKFKYRKEDGLVDLAIYREVYYKGIGNLYDPKTTKYNERELIAYPIFYDILIEHENKPELCFHEMTKLADFRSKLKVLITYNWDKEESEDYSYVYATLSKNFKEIIDQANKSCKETETEYLLMIGQYDHVESIKWKPYIYKP